MNKEEIRAEIAALKDYILEQQLNELDQDSDAEILKDQEIGKIEEEIASLKGFIAKSQNLPPPPPPDSFWDDTLDVAGEYSASANEGALIGADMVTAPFRVTGEFITGKDVRAPSEMTSLGQGGFMDAGIARDAVQAAGALTTAGGGMAGVKRAGTTVVDVGLDILGVGSSTGTAAMRAAQTTRTALTDSQTLRQGGELRGDQIVNRAQEIIDEINIDKNRVNFDYYEELKAWRLKNEELVAAGEKPEKVFKWDVGKKKPLKLKDVGVPRPLHTAKMDDVVTRLREEGVSDDDALEALLKRGIKFDDGFDDLIRKDQVIKDAGKGTKVKKDPGWYDRNFLPVADILRKYVSPQVGARFERAVERATRYSEQIVTKHAKPLERVGDLIDNDLALKRAFLDVGRQPAKMVEIMKTIKGKLGEEAWKAFAEFMKDSRRQSKMAKEKMFKSDKRFNEQFHFHTEKKSEIIPQDLWKRRGKKETEAPSALRAKSRKPAHKMTDEEVADYENPLWSQMKHMGDQMQLLQLNEKFGLRNSLNVNSNVDDFFLKGMRQRLLADGVSAKAADNAVHTMKQTYLGAKDAPPPWIRAAMSLGYAGTLAQFKSAVLNLHDAFVSAVNNGAMNTTKGAFSTMEREFGKALTDMGIGSQSSGEFVRSMSSTLQNPTKMDKVADYAQNFTDGGMFISGFRTLDRTGKGVVLRSAVNKMRESAKKGTLAEDFKDIASVEELKKIRPYLKQNMRAKDMPPDAQALVEDLAFVALGKQQLISSAGRPLGYLNNPILRPAYAMTGFAIKQQAMLREGVLDAISQGRYADAGSYAAKYMMYAGIGYAGLDVGRDSLFKLEPPESKGDVFASFMEQMAGVVFMNKYSPNDYTHNQIKQHGIASYVMDAFLPPTALFDAVSKDIMAVVSNAMSGTTDKKMSHTLERIPAVGDIWKYWINKD